MYYLVGLFKYNHNEKKSEMVGELIIKKGVKTAQEIFTGTELPIVKNNVKNKGLFKHDFLYVNDNALIDACLVSKEHVIDYINSFNVDRFNNLLNTDYYYNLKKKKRIEKCIKKVEKGVNKNA